ncbi:hypothetical protein GPZ77_00210 [Streptomyces sp. QHH-9511]|uniref:hypothetical protein n=1 Tax=Streptomyces sp. QHH-9511 TaxID=2684468 RepID=UPI001318A365|nr:hypothetical protein [Streptomyces sp. QHH-9511]QGZ47058.1 hypothetical protein GPZ77_00210 [Streptomyces sp. QHH-9511]
MPRPQPTAGRRSTELQLSGGIDNTGTDIMVFGDTYLPHQFRSVNLKDMSDENAAPVSIDLAPLNATYVKAVGPAAVLAQAVQADGTKELILVTKNGTDVSHRKITGLPADARDFFSTAHVLNGTTLVGYATDSVAGHEGGRAVVDATTARPSQRTPRTFEATSASSAPRSPFPPHTWPGPTTPTKAPSWSPSTG